MTADARARAKVVAVTTENADDTSTATTSNGGTDVIPDVTSDATPDATAEVEPPVTWSPADRPTFNSPAADLNQLRNEAKRIADAAPGQPVHDAVLSRARALAAAVDHDLGLPATANGLSYADLAVLLSQSR
jgi:hypothetical protein